MAGYTYNPAASIKQGFTEAKIDMGDIFAQVLERQKRDYDLAENTFSNIEGLKKDLNIFGQRSITDKANTLLYNASQSILQNGKIDYSKLGEIRQAVSDIKDLKTGYDLAGNEFEKWVKMGYDNRDNLNSWEAYYKDITSKMSDENLLKNPRDMQAALADTYTNNLDAVKMIGKSYLNKNPLYKVPPTDVIDPKTKALIRVTGEMAAGWKPDGRGGLIEPDPIVITNPDGTQRTVTWKEQALAEVNATNPQAIPALRKQYGYAAKGMSDEDLLAYAVRKIPMQSSATQVKSASAIESEESKAKTDAVTADYAEKKIKSDLLTERTQRRLTNKQIDKIDAEILASKVPASSGEVFTVNFPAAIKGGKSVGNVGAKGTDLGGVIPMIVPTSTGNKNVNVKQVFYDNKGNARVSYLEETQAGKGNSAYPNADLPNIPGMSGDKASKSERLRYALIPKAKVASFLSGLKTNIRSKYKDDKDYRKVWGNVEQTFTTEAHSAGDRDGDIIYLTRAYQKDEAQILKESGAKEVIYID